MAMEYVKIFTSSPDGSLAEISADNPLPSTVSTDNPLDTKLSATTVGVLAAAIASALIAAAIVSPMKVAIPGSVPITAASAIPVSIAASVPITSASPLPITMPLAGHTTVTTSASVAQASVQLVGSNANRLGFYVWNNGANSAYLTFGTTSSSANPTIILATFATFIETTPIHYTGPISAIRNSGSGTLTVTELTQ